MAIGPGSRGPEVLQHQRNLLAAGFDPGPLDGVWGPRTGAATAAHHAKATGSAPSDPILAAELAAQKAAIDRENARIAEQRAIDIQQRNNQRYLEVVSRQQGINVNNADIEQARLGLHQGLGAVETQRGFDQKETERTSALERAAMQNQTTASGMGLSGVREGLEARKTGELTAKTGAITLAAQQQKDALARAAAERQAKSMADIARLRAEAEAIWGQQGQ